MYTKPATDDLTLDSDNDGLSNSVEYALGSDSYQFDTDGDGISDTIEVKQQTNPRIESFPITDPMAARERYFHHASLLLGWALDQSVHQRAISQGESSTNAVYLLAQSPFLQYHKEAGLIGVKEMAEYTQQLLVEHQNTVKQNHEQKRDLSEPELED